MMTTRNSAITLAEARAAVRARAGSETATAAAEMLGITRPALYRRLRAAEKMGITAAGEFNAAQALDFEVPRAGVARYILTAAQSNTDVHPAFWENLRALADYLGARIMVARVRYNHTSGQIGQEKTNRAADTSLWYAPQVQPFLADDRVRLAPGLIWAGDMNILPTAANPLSGLDSFTGVESCIFPHMQLALRSVATGRADPAKFNYTTGACTLANYIKRKAGLKAEFHHAFAALMVEVDAAGDWFVRQLNADREGTIHDLGLRAKGGTVSAGHFVAAFNPGDIHAVHLAPEVKAALWGEGGLVDTLHPKVQVFHDIFDMDARSHHNDAIDTFRLHTTGRESVANEVRQTAAVMADLVRDFAQSVVVRANHDEHLERWLRDGNFRADPVNARFYLQAADALLAAIEEGDTAFNVLAWAMERAGAPPMRYLARLEPFSVAGIDLSDHGDQGPSGGRGSARALSMTGRKKNIGHSHAAAIWAGCYQAGTCTPRWLDYCTGPSAWSWSHILTYENGKRAIITQRGEKWRAE